MSKKKSLESSLKEISKIINDMESNEFTLEQSLASFERGVHLIKDCQTMLQQAEQKIQILINQTELQPFQNRDNNDND